MKSSTTIQFVGDKSTLNAFSESIKTIARAMNLDVSVIKPAQVIDVLAETEDGQPIRVGDALYVVNFNSEATPVYAGKFVATETFNPVEGRVYFLSIEKATEFIKNRTKKFSTIDILDFLRNETFIKEDVAEHIIEKLSTK